jgi:hypothetical protein
MILTAHVSLRRISAMVYSLLYISDNMATASSLDATTDAIVATSLRRNARLHITGALVATGGHFAQILEGPRASIGQLMDSIASDARHANVRVIDAHDIDQRFFPCWSLAYLGSRTNWSGRSDCWHGPMPAASPPSPPRWNSPIAPGRSLGSTTTGAKASELLATIPGIGFSPHPG